MARFNRPALKPIYASLAAAALALVGSVLIKRFDLSMPVKVLVALLPLPAYVVLVVVILRGVRAMDEMQRRIHMEAAAICLTLTVMITLTYGFLGLAGAPQPSWAFVAGMMGLLYAGGYGLASRNYR